MDEPTARADTPDRITALWRWAKEHRIAQWTVGYVAVAYGIQHAVTLTSEAFDWPHLITRISMLLLALGLPVAMTLAWYHGERISRRMSTGELSILSVLLVIASLLFYTLVRPSTEAQTASAPAVQEAGVTAARNAAQSPKGAISVAVLPFLNLSSDKEQEFFSDGMTEEITAALAKVPDMRVVARTSAFEFKGKNVGIQSIGQQLHATHLIEGSVRKSGNRLRITAQLIKAADGTHIWAEDYDRELTDVFAIQEEIARAITSSLHMTLGLKPGENLVNDRDIDPALYQSYLRDRAKLRSDPRTTTDHEVMADIAKLVVREPRFASAWSFYGRLYVRHTNETYWSLWSKSPDEIHHLLDDDYGHAEMAAREALRLDPRQAEAYAVLAAVEGHRLHWAAAEDLEKTALQIDPNNPDILMNYGFGLLKVGYLRKGLQFAKEAQALEPLAPNFNTLLGWALLDNGQTPAAIAAVADKPSPNGLTQSVLTQAYAQAGQFDKAADAILLEKRGILIPRLWGKKTIDEAARLMRSAPAHVRDPKALPPMHEWINPVYAYVGAEDRLLDYAERALASDDFGEVRYLFGPAYAGVRKTARFKALVRNGGLVDYWRARGWPDLCHPTTGDDFECS